MIGGRGPGPGDKIPEMAAMETCGWDLPLKKAAAIELPRVQVAPSPLGVPSRGRAKAPHALSDPWPMARHRVGHCYPLLDSSVGHALFWSVGLTAS